METTQELILKIMDWGDSTGILESGTVEGQSLKTIEEMSELVKGVLKHKVDLVKDSIGDVLVTIILGNALDQNYDLGRILLDVTHRNSEVSGSYDDSIKRSYELIRSIADLWRYPEDIYSGVSLRIVIEILLDVAEAYSTSLEECLSIAYNEIRSRDGKMINGQFVKSEDLANFEVDN